MALQLVVSFGRDSVTGVTRRVKRREFTTQRREFTAHRRDFTAHRREFTVTCGNGRPSKSASSAREKCPPAPPAPTLNRSFASSTPPGASSSGGGAWEAQLGGRTKGRRERAST
eukprot:1179390-Prorocentrum_minimum.AAC.1